MFNKKSLFALIILLFAISVVSASDVNSTQSDDVTLDAFSQNDTQLTEIESDVLESGQTVYFDASASVDGDGSKEKPYKYLSSNRLINVQTANFASGDYVLDDLIKISSASQKTTFAGENKNDTNIISNSFDFDFKILKGSSLELKDLTFFKFNILNQGNLEANNVNFYYTDSYETSLSPLDYNADVYDSYGGVIVCDSPEDSKTNITLNNCIFHSNSGESGAVIDAYNSNVLITNSKFHNSTSRRFGGVIYSLKSVLTIFNSEFYLNSAKYGGVIYAEDNSIDLSNSRFFNSQSSSFGGVMAVKSSTVTSKDCYFENYTSLSDGGGAFYDENCRLTIRGGTFYNGKSDFGGAICNLNSDLMLYDSYFINNAATFMGGAIFNDRGNINSEQSHFVNSYANSGGAIYSRISDSVTLTNNIFDKSDDNLGYSVFIENNTIYDLNSNQAVPLINYVPESQTNVPSSYDSRNYGYISPIKNQFSGANCWAFGSIATLEACLKKATGVSYDFSEENVKNLMSYYSLFGRTYEPNEGGVDSMAMTYFASWLGPVYDSFDEYDDYSGLSEVFSPLVHVQNIYCLPVRKNTDDNDAIKRAIMDYGAVTASVYWINTYHTISLIGWDDNYNGKDVFGNYAKGAWIVKNSWGTDLEDGFCHISYQKQFKNEIELPFSNFVYTFIFNDTEGYTRNYQYDFGGANYIHTVTNNELYYKNTFTSIGDEYLSAFSTFFVDPTNYEVSVYVGDKPVLTQKGYSPAGYYTIPFDSKIPLAQGDKFSIVIKNCNNRNISIPLCDASKINKMTFTDNVSFISADGNNWNDLYDYNLGCFVACIKAFTTPLELKDVTITVDKLTEVEANKEVSINAKLSNSQINGGTVEITINNKNYYADVKNGQASLKLKFNEIGTYSLSANYENNIYKSNVISFNFNVIKPTKVISISAPDVSKYYGGPEKFTATVNLNGKPLSGEYVAITIDGKTSNVKTNNAGQAIIDLNQGVGNYDVTTSYDGESNESKVEIKSTLAVSDLTGSYFNVYSSATFLNTNGKPLAGREVIFRINNNQFKATTNNNGVATAKIDLSVGEYNVIAINPANNEVKQFKLKISKATPTISLFCNQTDDSVTLTASLNPPAATGNVVFTFQQEDCPSQISDGNATLIITDLKSGSYDLGISYAGDANLNSVDVSKTFTVASNVVLSASDLEKYYGNPEKFKVYITDNNMPLSRASVKFTFEGDDYTATTGSDGVASINVPLYPGSYDIKYQYKDISQSSKIIVKSTITANNLSYVYEDSLVKATFLNSDGKAISKTNVAFIINGVSYKAVTDSNGVASSSVSLDAGKYDVEVSNPVNNEVKRFTLTISKKTPEIVFMMNDNNKVLTAKLSSIKATGNVVFTLEGKDYPIKVIGGESNFNLPSLTQGNYLISTKYSGDNNFNSASKRVNINVISQSPVLSAKSITKVFGDSKRLIIKLVDYNGKPIKNAIVYANVVASNGVKYANYKLKTDVNGEVRLACNFPAKTYNVVISSDSCKNIKTKVVVKKATPKLYVSAKSFKLKVKTKKYTITLKNNLNKAMKKTKVTLKIGRTTYSAYTNNYGKATFKITKLNKKGTYKATVRYAGNAYYNGVSKNVKIRVV